MPFTGVVPKLEGAGMGELAPVVPSPLGCRLLPKKLVGFGANILWVFC